MSMSKMVKYAIIRCKRTIFNVKGPCRNRNQTLVLCGVASCLTLFLLVFYHSKTRNMLLSTNIKLKSIFFDASDYEHLININFTFKILPLVCSEYEETLLILVHSSVDHFSHRKVIRETWGQHDDDVNILFLIGTVKDSVIQKDIEEESEFYKDILQGSFLDSYHNLTYKHVMALKYVVYHCPKTQFVLKVDDDVFVNTPTLKIFLQTYACEEENPRKILCSRSFNPPVLRSGKWAVSLEDYPEKKYPIHCGGYAILYPQDVIYPLYRTAQKTKYFWVDDVFVSGICARKSNITHIGVDNLILRKRGIEAVLKASKDANKPFLIAGINLKEHQIRALWNFSTKHVPKSMLDYLRYD